MNTQFEQYIKKAKSVAMTVEERSKILGNLKVAMERSPIRENTSGSMFINSPYFFHFTRQKVLVFALMAVFFLTTGTSFAAENALPGDKLYPIKVGVNEEVKGFFARSPVAEANLNAKIALRRLQEAETLQAEGRLDAGSRSIIESNFEAHAAKVKANLEASESGSDYEKTLEVANNFESSLHAHKGIFATLSAETETSERSETDTDKNSQHIVGVLTRVTSEFRSDTNSNIAASRLDAKAEAASQVQLNQKLNAVMARISEVEIYVNKVNIDIEIKERALNDIATAKDLAIQGKIKLEERSYKESFLLLANANNRIGRIYSSIKVENEANMELKGKINIHTGRPVDLNKRKDIDDIQSSIDAENSNDISINDSSMKSDARSSSDSNSNTNVNSVSSFDRSESGR